MLYETHMGRVQANQSTLRKVRVRPTLVSQYTVLGSQKYLIDERASNHPSSIFPGMEISMKSTFLTMVVLISCIVGPLPPFAAVSAPNRNAPFWRGGWAQRR